MEEIARLGWTRLAVVVVAVTLLSPAVASSRSSLGAAGCPVLTLSPPPGALPPGQVGVPYPPVTLEVSGGSGSYSWTHDYYGGTAAFPPSLSTSPALGQGGYGGATRTLSGTPSAPGQYSFQVTATDWPEYPDTRQGSCQVSGQYTLLVPGSDLTVYQAASPDPVTEGQQVMFHLRASNAGPTDAAGVTLEDTLPAGSTFLSATWRGEGAGDSGQCAHSTGVVSCAIGTLTEPNGSAAYADATITVIAPSAGEALENTASVASTVYDGDPDNNASSLIAELQPPLADLEATIAPSDGRVRAGGHLAVTIEAANHGPDDAGESGLNLTLTSSHLRSIGASIQTSAGSCEQRRGQKTIAVSCDFGSLEKHGHALVTLILMPGDVDQGSRSGTVRISVSAGSRSALDSTPANNAAHAVVQVGPAR